MLGRVGGGRIYGAAAPGFMFSGAMKRGPRGAALSELYAWDMNPRWLTYSPTP